MCIVLVTYFNFVCFFQCLNALFVQHRLISIFYDKKKQFHFIKLDFKDMQEMNTNI